MTAAGDDGLPPEAIRRTAIICNQKGLHARAAALFVRRSRTFNARVVVSRGGQTVPGNSILGLMMLAAAIGSEIEIAAHGADAESAVRSLCDLVACGFEENEG